MEAFEKWRDENIARPITEGTFVGLEMGWKACLEFIQSQCTIETDEYERPTGFLCIDDDIIKDELSE